ncbi:HCP-like protein [Coprinopsis marcescibilis]|uniref:HCP-like protein n=1 Tax=Coprinopsis marcescibilis TaxID=230819 RepID=A0A5C3KI56_COPMA|nr:HCP-like protein [Coprinopsis marcescibilis]
MSGRPPVPPIPSDLRQELARDRYAAATPLAAPRPQRVDPTIGDSLVQQITPASNPGMPLPVFGVTGPIATNVGDNGWTPWSVARGTPLPPTPAPMTIAAHVPPPLPPPSSTNELTAELPNIKTLLEALPSIQQPHFDPSLKITWARDVLFLADRAHHLHLTLNTPVGQTIPSLTDPIVGPMPMSAIEPELAQMVNAAVPMVLAIASPFQPGQPHTANSPQPEPWQAEAIYMRAIFSSTGAFPSHLPHSPKTAFRDFETAARGGYAGAWFRLGRDYETFGDLKHARECFERGARLGVEACLYRIGMAHLLGQLNFTANPSTALPILHRAAVLSSLECPQPAYVYALLLLSEFSSVVIPQSTFSSLQALTAYPPAQAVPQPHDPPLIPHNSSPHLESRLHLERSAFLHYPPAQYKLGHAYEFADPPFFFDPLLSVQYYSLASQAGEVEADMALSKWFLCGSTAGAPISSAELESGHFDKDEALALTFAEKASSRGLPSGHFAMGYYAEVGIGNNGRADVTTAVHYYKLAASLGNTDASARLQALENTDKPALLDKAVHQQRLERSRTQAYRRAEEEAVSPPYEGRTFPRMKDAQQQHRFGDPTVQGPLSATLTPPAPAYPHQSLAAPYSAGAAGGFPRLSTPPQGPSQGGRPGSRPMSQYPGGRPQSQFQPQRDPRKVVDLVRKNSVASSYLPLSTAAQSIVTANNGPPAYNTLQQQQQQQQYGGYGGQQRPQSAAPVRNQGQMSPAPGRPITVYGQGQGPGGNGYGQASPGRHTPQQSYSGPTGSGRQYASSPGPLNNSPGRQGSPYQQAPGQYNQQPQNQYNQSQQQQPPFRTSPPPNQYQPQTGPGRQGKLSVGVELSDTGLSPPPPIGGVGTATASTPLTSNAGRKHPATFAEMGIQGTKAEEKDCKIM